MKIIDKSLLMEVKALMKEGYSTLSIHGLLRRQGKPVPFLLVQQAYRQVINKQGEIFK